MACDRRAGFNVAKVLVDLLVRDLGVDIACYDKHGVRGAVVVAEPFLDVVEGGSVQVLHRTDDGPGVRMSLGPHTLRDELFGDPVGFILSLPLFILDHAALFVKLRLRDRSEEMTHAVRLHPESDIHCRGRNVLEVIRPVLVRRAVQVGRTEPLEHLKVVVVEVLAPVEHQMLEQVREAALARLLILRSYVIPDVHGYDRRFVVLVHEERETVLEYELLIRDVDVDHRSRGPLLLRDHRQWDGEQQKRECCKLRHE